jgi:hypothetical protein
LTKWSYAAGPRCSPRGGVLSRPLAAKPGGSLRPCLETTIAPRRRVNSAKPSYAARTSVTDRPPPFEFRLLGPLEVVSDRAVLPVGGPRQRALLAFLLLSANQIVARDRLIDALWGESPPATAANALQVAVHGLRKVLGQDRVLSRGGGYELLVQPGELDLDEFERVLGRARSGVATPAELRHALSLWRGLPGRRPQ